MKQGLVGRKRLGHGWRDAARNHQKPPHCSRKHTDLKVLYVPVL
jgi:hypothetical protein